MNLRIGGKYCRESGDPVDLDVRVMAIVENAVQSFGDVKSPIGDAVWLQADGNVNVMLNTIRGQTFNPDAFTGLGIDLSSLQIVIPKSSQHFYAGFAPIASDVIYATSPGCLNVEFGTIPFKNLNSAFWPNVEDPFAD